MGTYDVSQTITIARSGITVMGQYMWSRSNTTLRRSVPADYPIMVLADGRVNVTIKDFLFDGNSCLWAGCSLYWTVADDYIDLDLAGWSGTRHIYVEADFQNSSGFSIADAWQLGTIRYCNFDDGRISAVFSGSSSNNTTIFNNSFEYYGAGAIGTGGFNQYIDWNNIFRNHDEMPYDNCGGPCPGGQIVLFSSAHDIYVRDNWIDGNFVNTFGKWTHGVEAYGSYSHANNYYFQRNEVRSHRGSAIYLVGARGVQITNQGSSYKIQGNWTDGVEVRNYYGFPQSDNVTIDAAVSVNNTEWGVRIDPIPDGNGYGTITNVRVKNSTLTGNTLGPLCSDVPLTENYNNNPNTSNPPGCP